MKNKKICKLADQYFDGQIDTQKMEEFRNHLKSCKVCMKRIHELSSISEFIKCGLVEQLEKEVADNIWQRVENELLRNSLLPEIDEKKDFLAFLYKFLFKPLIVVACIVLIFIFPSLENNKSNIVLASEVNIEKISSGSNVFIFKTLSKKWTVIWIDEKGGIEDENPVEI